MTEQDPTARNSREQREREDGTIDQRQQQIDPAGHHRVDVNAPSKSSMKQPGRRRPAPDRTDGK